LRQGAKDDYFRRGVDLFDALREDVGQSFIAVLSHTQRVAPVIPRVSSELQAGRAFALAGQVTADHDR